VTRHHLAKTTSSTSSGTSTPVPDKDRDRYWAVLDLLDYADVVGHSDAIVGSLRSGQMPCNGAWHATQLDKLQQWIDMGKPA
jgi:hypothetical protein